MKKFKPHSIFRSKKAIPWIAGFAVAGTALLLFTQAATLYPVIEPESATLSSGAVMGTDANASGGAYIQFNASPTCAVGQTGTPPNCITPTPEPPSGGSSGTRPTLANTGPPAGTVFTDVASSTVDDGGTFTNCRTTGFSYGTTTPLVLRNCEVTGTIVVYSAASITFDHVRMNGSIYWEAAAHGTISYSSFSGSGQALRPKPTNYGDLVTLTPLVVENSYLYNPAGVIPQHVEAMQTLGGNGYTFRNVTFELGGPYNDTQTAVINHWAANTLFEDCWFIGGGNAYYTFYSEGPGNRFVRPKLSRGMAGYLYPAHTINPLVTDPTDLNGNPISI